MSDSDDSPFSEEVMDLLSQFLCFDWLFVLKEELTGMTTLDVVIRMSYSCQSLLFRSLSLFAVSRFD